MTPPAKTPSKNQAASDIPSQGNQVGLSPRQNVNENCGRCELQIKTKEKKITCDICRLSFHITCQSVSHVLHKLLAADEAGEIHWYCKVCRRGTESLFTNMAKIAKEQETIKRKSIA